MQMLALALLMCPAPLPAQEEGFASLSDDPALAAWRQPKENGWECQDGVIRRAKGGTLFTERIYEDFTLRLECKIGKGGNSGVFLRAPLSGRHSALGMEMQIMGDHGKAPGKSSTGALYDAKAPDVAAQSPDGEWNQVEVDFRGRHLRVAMNDQVIQDFDLDDPAVNEGLAEGQKLSQRCPRGYIGLQDHGHPVEFRNVRIREYPEDGFAAVVGGTLEGWTPSAEGAFEIQNDVLICTAPEEAPASLTYGTRFADHEVRLEYRVTEGAEAYWRPRTDDDPEHQPLEVVIADDGGSAPGTNASGALAGQVSTSLKGSRPPGQWNDLRMVFQGWSTHVYLNSVPVLSLPNANYVGKYRYAPLKGVPQIVIRKGQVEVKRVRVREL